MTLDLKSNINEMMESQSELEKGKFLRIPCRIEKQLLLINLVFVILILYITLIRRDKREIIMRIDSVY